MNCDKLKAEPMIINDDYTALYYPKYSVDAAIAELKDEKESALKAVSHWHDNYCELQKVVDRLQTKSECKEDKIRILKRALWMARAYRARDNSILLPSKFMRNVWDNVERKCRAKAEEYK